MEISYYSDRNYSILDNRYQSAVMDYQRGKTKGKNDVDRYESSGTYNFRQTNAY